MCMGRGRRMIEVGVFFFSSRRRHTRFDCDWSSDVCSSDLPEMIRTSDLCPPKAEVGCSNHLGRATFAIQRNSALLRRYWKNRAPDKVAAGFEDRPMQSGVVHFCNALCWEKSSHFFEK